MSWLWSYEREEQKDKGTKELCLMLCRPSTLGIKRRNELKERDKVKVYEFMPFLLVGIKGIFGIVEREPAANRSDNGSILVVALP